MSRAVLLFDGECGLCVALVRFVVRRDGAGRLGFATLQGNFGQAQLRRLGLPEADFDSLVFLPRGAEGPGWLRTEGALAALAELGGSWARLARGARCVPAGARDAIYRCVARWRRVFFGAGAGGAEALAAKWPGRFLP